MVLFNYTLGILCTMQVPSAKSQKSTHVRQVYPKYTHLQMNIRNTCL